RLAAIEQAWGGPRLFRFRRADGGFTDLALTDRDACCWARAVDATIGMGTPYGLTLCLRLLALVELLGRSPWAAELIAMRRDGAALHPGLLHAAATQALTAQARFDETPFRALVRDRLPPPTVPPPTMPPPSLAPPSLAPTATPPPQAARRKGMRQAPGASA
ncbi:MAG: hypothetical protein J0H91_17150, partial [Rhodospirillales bacterium]|nr:hypothetical protein [Rhodospirillales bacterium]